MIFNVFRVLTRGEINNHISVLLRNIDVKFADDVMIVSVLHQTVDIMHAVGIAVISVQYGSVVN